MIQEARSYYCPSGVDVVGPEPLHSWAHGVNQPAWPPGKPPIPQRLRDWQDAGGFDARTMTHGDWSWYVRTNTRTYGILSQYAYRNQSLESNLHAGDYRYDWHPYFGASGTWRLLDLQEPKLPLTIDFTNPRVVSERGAPSFKTPRQLTSRALVSDMFNKNGHTTPGVGNDVHKDGYNILYGDYSTSWYGDTEHRIIWWDVYRSGASFTDFDGRTYHGGITSANEHQHAQVLGYTGDFDVYRNWWGGASGSGLAQSLMQTSLVWHNFDRGRGLDQGGTSRWSDTPSGRLPYGQ